MIAMPAAAPVPRSIDAGIDQNGPSVLDVPSAASERAARAATGERRYATSVRPSAPKKAGPGTCQRRPPVRAECPPTTATPAAAATTGHADAAPTIASPAPARALA